MKLEPKHIVLILGLLFVAVSTVRAQDGSSMESMENEKEKIQYQYSPSGDEYSNYKSSQKALTRDSVSIRANHRMGETQRLQGSEKQSGSKSEDNSVLSFNFLYYIIQKFKMSDIVDQ